MSQRVGGRRSGRRDRERRGRKGGRGSGICRHEGNLGRAGTGRTEGRSLSTPTAQTRPGNPLPLGIAQEEKGPALSAGPFDVARKKTPAHPGGIDEPVGPALDVGNPIEVAGAGRTKEHGAMAARVGDDLQPLEAPAIGERERLVEDDHLPGARARLGGLRATGGGVFAAVEPAIAPHIRGRSASADRGSVRGNRDSYGPIDSSMSL